MTLGYQYFDTYAHLTSVDVTGRTFPGGYIGDGKQVVAGDIKDQNAVLEGEYGLTDRLTASGSLAYTGSRYEGGGGHRQLPGHVFVDDGSYHSTFQDASIGVRYLAVNRSFAVIPFARFSFPTHRYENVGHAAAGRRLNELQVGARIARSLDPILPDGYVRGSIAYGFVVQPEQDIRVAEFVLNRDLNINRWYLNLDAGYYVTPRLALNAFANYFDTLGGIDWALDLRTPKDYDNVGHVHDAAADVRQTVLGGGLSFAVTPGLWVYASFASKVAGENTHSGNAFSLGTSFGFGRKQATQPVP